MSQALLLRRLVLVAHITSSLGWFGAVAAFLALAIAGLTSPDAATVRAASVAMGLVAWYVILPLNLGSLATGLIQGVVSPWGLLRHYWVVVKLALTVLATAFFLLHLQPIGLVAGAAGDATRSAVDLRGVRQQLVADAVAALVVLLVNTSLSVFKPAGLTRYGWRKQRDRQQAPPPQAS